MIPGRTSCLLNCSFEYNGIYFGNNGLGPINAISPFSTLINCGNSSMENERTIFPIFVKRATSGNKLPSASLSSVIVLNLIILKILAPLPGRPCVKKTPAPLFTKCNHIVIINKTGHITSKTLKTKIKSITRLKKNLYITDNYLVATQFRIYSL